MKYLCNFRENQQLVVPNLAAAGRLRQRVLYLLIPRRRDPLHPRVGPGARGEGK